MNTTGNKIKEKIKLTAEQHKKRRDLSNTKTKNSAV